MADPIKSLLECVVCDTGAFIKCDRLDKIAKEIYTTRDVINEIRDKTTRDKLNVLPFELKFREPSGEAIRNVTEFAKKTGDYRSLSSVDIRIIALTFQLCVEHGGKDTLRMEPARLVNSSSPLNNVANPIGFYSGFKEATGGRANVNTNSQKVDQPQNYIIMDSASKLAQVESTTRDNNADDSMDVEGTVVHSMNQTTERLTDSDAAADVINIVNEINESSMIDGEELSSDEEGWITPRNVNQVKKTLNKQVMCSSDVTPKIGCITTDFAIQNILIQMRLPVISVDGYLIRQVKNYALRCYSCSKITTDNSRQFCPFCGNSTLTKVSISVNDKGEKCCHLARKKQFSTKGTKFSLPKPQGGRFNTDPQLCEDQHINQMKKPQSQRNKLNVFDCDYIARSSPFLTNDVHSRAAILHFQGIGQNRSRRLKNPNQVVNKGKRRK